MWSAQRAARQIFQSIETRDPSTEALRDKSEGQNINLRTSSWHPVVTFYTQERKLIRSESESVTEEVKQVAGQLLDAFMNTAHNILDRNSLHTVLIHNIKGFPSRQHRPDTHHLDIHLTDIDELADLWDQ